MNSSSASTCPYSKELKTMKGFLKKIGYEGSSSSTINEDSDSDSEPEFFDSEFSSMDFNSKLWSVAFEKAGNRPFGFATVLGQTKLDAKASVGDRWTMINSAMYIQNHPMVFTRNGEEIAIFLIHIFGDLNYDTNYRNVYFANLISGIMIFNFSKFVFAGLDLGSMDFLIKLFLSNPDTTHLNHRMHLINFLEPLVNYGEYHGSLYEEKYDHLLQILPKNSIHYFSKGLSTGFFDEYFLGQTYLKGPNIRKLSIFKSPQVALLFLEMAWEMTNFIKYIPRSGNFMVEENDKSATRHAKILDVGTKMYRAIFKTCLANENFNDEKQLLKLHEKVSLEVQTFLTNNTLFEEIRYRLAHFLIKEQFSFIRRKNKFNIINSSDLDVIDEETQAAITQIMKDILNDGKANLNNFFSSLPPVEDNDLESFPQTVVEEFDEYYNRILDTRQTDQIVNMREELLEYIDSCKRKLVLSNYIKTQIIPQYVRQHKLIMHIKYNDQGLHPIAICQDHLANKLKLANMLEDRLQYSIINETILENDKETLMKLLNRELEEVFSELVSGYGTERAELTKKYWNEIKDLQ